MEKPEFQTLRAHIGLCESILTSHPEDYARLREMFRRHPTAGEGIIDLRARRNPVWGGIDYFAVYETAEYSISANACFYKNPTKEAHQKRKMKMAARVTIRGQIDDFRTVTPCPCGSTLKLQVDHVRHFDDLLTTFLNGRIPTDFDYTDGCEAVFKEPIAAEWRAFHQTNAELRMLCAKCNLSRPKWKKT